MEKGTIRNLISDRGFGFITKEQGGDLFFHRSELQGVDFSFLRAGQQVEFEVGQGRDSRPQAVKVRLAQPEATAVAQQTEPATDAAKEETTQAPEKNAVGANGNSSEQGQDGAPEPQPNIGGGSDADQGQAGGADEGQTGETDGGQAGLGGQSEDTGGGLGPAEPENLQPGNEERSGGEPPLQSDPSG